MKKEFDQSENKIKKNKTAKLRQSYTFRRLAILSARGRGRGKRLVLVNQMN